ncbi:hypothetical protein AVEN_128643-1 [Araneus ventricosus]|uniref:Uncharacterized protein n=1 Tax=Araneus ventricosus TaxID=182803 RepID=A0A4Y2WNQ5_ARAVE|nr:hypothetical protein AVEN_128643-1 [Araneus ventricosus]
MCKKQQENGGTTLYSRIFRKHEVRVQENTALGKLQHQQTATRTTTVMATTMRSALITDQLAKNKTRRYSSNSEVVQRRLQSINTLTVDQHSHYCSWIRAQSFQCPHRLALMSHGIIWISAPNRDIKKIPVLLRSHISSPKWSPRSEVDGSIPLAFPYIPLYNCLPNHKTNLAWERLSMFVTIFCLELRQG